MTVTVHIALYGLIAALSPTVLLATLVVLGSGRGRVNGLVFLIAFLIGQTLAYGAARALGTVIAPGSDASDRVVGALEVAAGAALVAIGLQRRRRPPSPTPGTARSQALFDRLSHVKPALSFGVGMPLGVGVKRLVITILAASTVTAADVSRVHGVALGALYIALASLVVWVPVIGYLVLGGRADGLVASARAWITEHEDSLTVISAIVLGAFLLVDGIVTFV